MKTTKRILMFLVALIATTGAWADVIEVGTDAGNVTSGYLPSYSLYNYSLTEQIYTPAEIGYAGTINSIAFYSGGSTTRNLDIYMFEGMMSTFGPGDSYSVSASNSKLVFSGDVTWTAGGWTTITLDKPFAYTGEGNLILVVNDKTGNWVSTVQFRVFETEETQAIYLYQDSAPYDPTDPSQYNFKLMAKKNQLKLDMSNATPLAAGFDLSVGKNEHGTIEFTVGGAAAEKAEVDAEVTVTVTPEDGWAINEVEARPYTGWETAKAPSLTPQILTIDLIPVDGVNNQWAFKMPAYPVEVSATYQKIIQLDWIQPIEDLVFTGKAIEPELFITDGDKILVAGTDYTVAYANNVNVGEATVTVKGIEYYTGEVVLHFNIVRLENPVYTSPTAIEGLVFNGEQQALIVPGTVENGYAFLLYSLSTATSSFSAEVPTAKDAGQYSVYYKLNGNENVKGTQASSITVFIAPKPAEDVDLKLEVKEDGTLYIADGDTELQDGIDYDLVITDAKGVKVDLGQDAPETEEAPALRRAVNLNDLNLPAGDYKAFIELKGNYTGTLEKEFTYSGPTGISVVSSQKEAKGEFYNINGQRVSQPTKGLYIVNGKKVIIK